MQDAAVAAAISSELRRGRSVLGLVRVAQKSPPRLRVPQAR